VQNSNDIAGNCGTKVAPDTAPVLSRKTTLASTAAELQAERTGNLPVWVRPPTKGHEHFSGFSRSKLYELATDRLIRSTSIRKPGQTKGTRLFHLGSVLDYIAACEQCDAEGKAEA